MRRRQPCHQTGAPWKKLTIVDNNPISFVIAHKFFGLPDDLACVVSDFRNFIIRTTRFTTASPSTSAARGFSSTMGSMSRPASVRAPTGAGRPHRDDVLVDNDIDPTPDRIAARSPATA